LLAQVEKYFLAKKTLSSLGLSKSLVKEWVDRVESVFREQWIEKGAGQLLTDKYLCVL